jgi:drug/metabolite transporter (DMT)-like permease
VQSSNNHPPLVDANPWLLRPAVLGTLCGIGSSVGYTAANICLRAAAELDPIWVSAVKAAPTAIVCGIALLWWRLQRRRVMPSMRVVLGLILGGLFGQLGGNVMFQHALGIVGIGLTVPLCLGMLIISGAVLARVFLNESVTSLAMAAMGLLIAAIWVLSLGAGDAYRSIAGEAAQGWLLAWGVIAACFSGFAYAVLGVVIRWAVTRQASVAATTFSVCWVGVVALGALSYGRLGWSGIGETTARDWAIMLAAGTFNLLAFLALTRALQLVTLVYLNALNASQVALAAIAGVLLFRESLTTALTIGVGLTALGLLLMPRDDKRVAHGDDECREEPIVDCSVQNERNRSSNSTSCSSSQSANSVASSSETNPSRGSATAERVVATES